jgi:hypothetical protein
MRIEIQRDKPNGFRVVAIENGSWEDLMRGIPNMGEARTRACNLARSLGDNVCVVNCVNDRIQHHQSPTTSRLALLLQ